MKTLHYHIHVNANRQHVWNTMLNKATYNDWAKAFSPKSIYEGEFAEDGEVRFIDPDRGGTKAVIKNFDRYHRFLAKHVAVINKDGSEDTVGDFAKQWIGTSVEYLLEDNRIGTTITIKATTSEQYVQMLNEGFPKALALLKQLCQSK